MPAATRHRQTAPSVMQDDARVWRSDTASRPVDRLECSRARANRWKSSARPLRNATRGPLPERPTLSRWQMAGNGHRSAPLPLDGRSVAPARRHRPRGLRRGAPGREQHLVLLDPGRARAAHQLIAKLHTRQEVLGLHATGLAQVVEKRQELHRTGRAAQSLVTPGNAPPGASPFVSTPSADTACSCAPAVGDTAAGDSVC